MPTPRYSQMLGYAEEALIDRIPVTEIVGPQHRAKVKDVIRSLTPGSNQRFQYTACLTRRDGTSVTLRCIAVPSTSQTSPPASAW